MSDNGNHTASHNHNRLYYKGAYKTARKRAIERSAGVCQSCGMRPAEQTHHWAPPGCKPTRYEVSPDDLIALCPACHDMAEEVRHALCKGIKPRQMVLALRAAARVLIEERFEARRTANGDGRP